MVREMMHEINNSLSIPEKVRQEINEAQAVLHDILSWLFETEVHVVPTVRQTIECEKDDSPESKLFKISPESKFKIVVALNRKKVVGIVMAKLSVEQQAELSAYLMRGEYDRG